MSHKLRSIKYIPMTLILLLSLGGCGEKADQIVLSEDYIKDVPGVDLTGLSDQQRVLAIKILNEFVCKYGCAEGLTIAQAQTERKDCVISKRLAEIVVQNVQSGMAANLEEEILRIAKGADYAASPPPEKIYSVPVGDAPTKGPPEAPVTLVIFTDFQ
ncbi:MAG: hypothetical protein ACE5OR_12255 [bacterium]